MADGAKQIWKAKDEARNDRISGSTRKGCHSRIAVRKRLRDQDIRILFRRAAIKAARTQGSGTDSIDLDLMTCDQLLHDANTAPIKATQHLTRLNTHRVAKARRPGKNRWTPSSEHQQFTMTRDHSYRMLTMLTRKLVEYRRTVRALHPHHIPHMDWLNNAEVKTMEQGLQQDNLR